TDRTARAQNKRRTWHQQIVRDADGEPVMGQWTPIVEPRVWWAVQERLDDPRRVTNRSGSTARKHIGAGLYRCGRCGSPVVTHSRAYRCEGHIVRSREQVDAWVLRVVRERLARPDVADSIPTAGEPTEPPTEAGIATRGARIASRQQQCDARVVD